MKGVSPGRGHQSRAGTRWDQATGVKYSWERGARRARIFSASQPEARSQGLPTHVHTQVYVRQALCREDVLFPTLSKLKYCLLLRTFPGFAHCFPISSFPCVHPGKDVVPSLKHMEMMKLRLRN